MDIKLEITEDGSHTIFVPTLNEHYHSTKGAIQEARHIFIDSAFNQCPKSNIKILEVGFGTGLNAFITMLEAEKNNQQIEYSTLEFYPIPLSSIKRINYPSLIDETKRELYYKLHTAEWDNNIQITSHFSIFKKLIDFSNPDNLITDEKYDIVYFDAFGPDKQPEMWQPPIFQKIYSMMNEGGILTTYSAKGVIRRTMQSIGFKVERIPGPPGKREILRATK